jgi:hypothetical protein
MKDPVILPSSRITVDRPVIQRHLLSDNVYLHILIFWGFTAPLSLSLSLKIIMSMVICLM